MRVVSRLVGSLRRRDWIALAIILAIAAAAPALFLFEQGAESAKPSTVPIAAAPPTPPKADRRIVAVPVATTYVVQPPYDIVDALTFARVNTARTRLIDVEGPGTQAVCLDKDDRPWACGLAGRAALSSALALKPVECEPVRGASDVQLSRCSNDGGDLARQLIAKGFARPADGTDTPELKAAREARIGMWNGGWRLKN